MESNINNGSMKEVKNPEEGKSLHPGENLVAQNADNLAQAEAMVNETPLETENTPDSDDDEYEDEDYDDGDLSDDEDDE